MPHRASRGPLAAALAATLATALLASGCGARSIAIPPAPAGPADAGDPGLGPGVRPLSFGPGQKSSPRFSPSGDRVAFILDGAVAEKPLDARSFGRKTEDDLTASDAEWLSEDDLAVRGRRPAGESAAGAPDSLFITRPGDAPGIPPGSLEIARDVEASDALPEGGLVAAAAAPRDKGDSKLMLFRKRAKTYPGTITGRVLGLSVAPDGGEATLAVRREGEGDAADRVELLSYSFSEGSARRVALLNEGQELLGSPQWTDGGIHFVAGKEGGPYALYRLQEGSEEPEPVRGVGEGFLPAAIEASPDGERLAVVGRRNAGSPTDLYILDLASGTLKAVTANEHMEVQTGPRDLAWSPDGSGVALIARAALSRPEVYDAPARSLAAAFYNLYLAPVRGPGERTAEEADAR